MAIKKIPNYVLPEYQEAVKNKINWEIEREKAVLLIHDMQVYFTDAYDKAGEPFQTIIRNMIALKEVCKENNIPVVYSAQPEGQLPSQRGLLLDFWGEGIPAGQKKQDIIKELQPDTDDLVITKWRYSAFENTSLEELMKKWGKSQILITGIYAHIGCLTTAVAASMKNIKPFVIADAMGDFSREKHCLSLEYIGQLAGMILDTAQAVEVLKNHDAGSVKPELSA